jgi:hypothetical protein
MGKGGKKGKVKPLQKNTKLTEEEIQRRALLEDEQRSELEAIQAIYENDCSILTEISDDLYGSFSRREAEHD